MSSGCEWSDLADSCLVFNCLNLTSAAECQHSYHNCSWDGVTDKCTRAGPPPPACEPARVGRLNLSAVSWGAGHAHSVIDWWHLNTLQKMQGMWFDTPRTAYCDPRAPQDPCSWRVVAAVKKIQKNCSDASISAAVMGAGMCITRYTSIVASKLDARHQLDRWSFADTAVFWSGTECFNACPTAERYNTTSECYIRCFYATVLGPHAGTGAIHPGDDGMPIDVLEAAWNQPFASEDRHQGGCPNLL